MCEDYDYRDVDLGNDPELYTFSNYIVDQELLKDGREPTLADLRFLWPGYSASYRTYCRNNGYESESLFI